MENVLDNNLETDSLVINGTMRTLLAKQAYWSRFLGIMGIVLYSIMILVSVLGGGVMFAVYDKMGIKGMGTIMMIIAVAMSALMIYISFLGFDHGRKVLQSLRTNSQDLFVVGVEQLAKLIKIQGIMLVVFIGIYIILGLFAAINLM